MNEFTRSIDWLLNSGIQNIEGEHAGGFNGWYDITNGTYPFVYSEITGYGITALLYANSIRPDPVTIRRASMAADWIINHAIHDCGGVRARLYYKDADPHFSFDNNILYIFDSGTVLSGLVNVYLITKNKSYLNAAVKIGNFLLAMQRKDGLLYAAYDANNKRFINTQDKWSTQCGSYHAKLSIGLLDLYDVTGNETFRRSAEKICEASIAKQRPDGGFITQDSEESTHMHPHCYSAEGLVYAGIRLDREEFIESSLKAIAWALDKQLNNGGVPCKYINGTVITHERSDTLAQVLRLGAFFQATGKIKKQPELDLLADRLRQFQNLSGTHMGGFFYGTELDGTQKLHINSWCSMFAMQALSMHRSFKESDKPDLRLLI